MKSIVFLACALLTVIASAKSQQPPEEVFYELTAEQRKVIALECIDETGVNKKLVEYAGKTGIVPRFDPKYRSFLSCSYKKQGYLSEDGTVLYLQNIIHFLKAFYKSDELADFEQICSSVYGANSGDLAFNALDCTLTSLKLIDDLRDGGLKNSIN